MINQTIIQETLKTFDTLSDSIKYLSTELFLPSIIFYWFFQFLLILIIGLATVKKNKEKFWAIFVITQLVGGILLFLIFVFPVIPQMLNKIM